ncbi:MAG: hypothetical protein GC168_13760 [Candidatus Hydrogenedens sp.]|nr:hypothetical protein [Candidatus Hydrogenedens sp.]
MGLGRMGLWSALGILLLSAGPVWASTFVVVDAGSAMQYIEPLQSLPNSGTPLGWIAQGYDTSQDIGKGDAGNGSSGWQAGVYGVGYADGDDATLIDADGSVYSVYTRATFNVANAAAILAMVLDIDYDDGYIAWLNGTEISRSAGMVGIAPDWNALCAASHEATFSWGTPIDLTTFVGLLQNGTNTLAFAAWNNATNSSDMTLRPRLSLYDTPYVAAPVHTYLTWQGDTGTTMTVNYHTGATAGLSKVYYDTVSHGGDYTAYANVATGSSHQVPGLNTYVTRNIHWVELTGLTPGETYYCVAGDPAVALTGEIKFRTIRSGDVPITFTQGGDMGTSSAVGQLMAAAAQLEPDFMVFGGDCAYEDGSLANYAAWDTVLNYYEDNMVTPQGYTVPMLVAIGNHEVQGGWGQTPAQAPFYYNYFAQAGNQAYFTRAFGSNLMMIALDSGHTTSITGTQATWLSSTLASVASYPYRFAVYHVPMYPSVRSFTGDSNIVNVRNGWRAIFDQYQLTTALENHDHALKRTKVLKNDQPDPNGTFYVGDGCMGQTVRNPDQAGNYYLERAVPVQHFWKIEIPSTCVTGASPSYTAYDVNGLAIDHHHRRPEMASPTSLVSPGASWKYLDNGTDQGTAWRDPAFNDAAWASGAAELGYGDTPVTTVSYGSDANNKYISTYLRHTFNIANPAAFGHLKLRLKRDDGAVVYLNGAEVYRVNMTMTGSIAYNTLATSTVGGADEETFFDSPEIQNMLVAGNNVLAVELHQSAVDSSDLSFDLELLGYPTTETVLSARGATWKYLDNGSNQGTAWRAAAFNDASWASGPAELGYGDAPVTTVSYGADPNNKYVTTYFRRSFSVADASLYRGMALNVQRDDGVIVYLNNVEIYRSNMPYGVQTYTTLAFAAVDTFQENTYFPSPVMQNALVDGVNVLAVEVHQSAVTSSDLSFDLELVGIRGTNNIDAMAGSNGSISPAGATGVLDGASQAYSFTPAPGYHIADVEVDCESIGAPAGYTFSDVSAPHRIDVTFAADPVITASAGSGGSIAPAGATSVAPGGSQGYTITPAACFSIADVLVNGSSVGAVSNYTFNNVTANQTIAATFVANGPYSISASAGSGGSITSPGVSSVACGGSKAYTITPAACFSIADVLVNGSSVGAVSSYTFNNVTANQTVTATFVANGPYSISASAGSGGSITSSGVSSVACGGSKSYTITPAACFSIADVLVNGSSVGAVSSYTFNNVTANQTIAATFVANGPYSISASAGSGGSITSSGVSSVACGGSKSYTITPAACFSIADVLVNGSSVGAVSSYTFNNVTANQTITAIFAANGPYNILATAGAGGSIAPAGTVSTACGANAAFTITPALGFHVFDVQVDATSIGAVGTYTFTNVTATHTIHAEFEVDAVEGEGEGEGNTDPIQVTGPAAAVERHIGESLTLEVQATGGAAPLHFQWYRQRNAGPLEPVGDDAPDFFIASVQQSDAGIYYCVVTDGIDIVVSDTAELIVLEALPMHILLPLAAALLLAMAAHLTRRARNKGDA